MDMSNIAAGEILAGNVDLGPINNAIKERAAALGGEMNPEAAAQFISDMSSLECKVKGEGNSISFSVSPVQSYLIDYLKNHGVPVAGGDGGTAHNVDGSTYASAVDPDLWGTELPWLELPHLDGEDEAGEIVKLMGTDCVTEALSRSKDAIAERAAPVIQEEAARILGGGLE